MIKITRIDQDTPIKQRFEMLMNGSMFVDPEELELMIKVSESDAIMIDSGETFGYDPSYEILLCDVDIAYSLRFK
jgi:hypothetical protein